MGNNRIAQHQSHINRTTIYIPTLEGIETYIKAMVESDSVEPAKTKKKAIKTRENMICHFGADPKNPKEPQILHILADGYIQITAVTVPIYNTLLFVNITNMKGFEPQPGYEPILGSGGMLVFEDSRILFHPICISVLLYLLCNVS